MTNYCKHTEKCETCDGLGVVVKPNYDKAGDYWNGGCNKPCLACRGTGKQCPGGDRADHIVEPNKKVVTMSEIDELKADVQAGIENNGTHAAVNNATVLKLIAQIEQDAKIIAELKTKAKKAYAAGFKDGFYEEGI